MSWLKHISNYEHQPLGSVNPHLQQHTASVTLLVPCQISKFEVQGMDEWTEVRGGVGRRCKSKRRRL